MIDYQELKKTFKAKLDSFNLEMLSKWIEFDRERDTVSKLLEGETVIIKNTTVSRVTLSDERENICHTSTSQLPKYAMAA